MSQRNALTLVVDQALPATERLFAPFGRVIALPGESIRNETLREADVLLVRSRTKVNEALLRGTSVQFVGSGVAGLDHVDDLYLTARGIPFISAPGCNATAVAEYVIAALWLTRGDPETIASKTMAIIGVGHVGRAVHQKAAALGIHCLLNDPPRVRREHLTGFADLDECLQKADVVSLHTPLTVTGADPTLHLINSEQLAKMRPGTTLINAARGDVINETCLPTRPDLKLLMDCWHNEPHITPATLAATQLATPHIAGYSAEANLRGSFVLYQALCAHFGQPETFRYDDLLPPAPAALRLPNPQRPLHALLQDLLFQTTPLAHLDYTLRTATGDTSAVFKQLRSACQQRREWSAYRVYRDGIPEAVYQTLTALGFRFI